MGTGRVELSTHSHTTVQMADASSSTNVCEGEGGGMDSAGWEKRGEPFDFALSPCASCNLNVVLVEAEQKLARG